MSTVTYDGPINQGDWFDSANWVGNAVPDTGDIAVVNGAAPQILNATVASLTIEFSVSGGLAGLYLNDAQLSDDTLDVNGAGGAEIASFGTSSIGGVVNISNGQELEVDLVASSGAP